MKYNFLFLLVILSLIGSACSDINEGQSEEGKISVICTLQTGGDKQYVKVCRLSRLSEDRNFDSLTIKDAEVKLIGESFSENFNYGILSYDYGIYKDYYYESQNSMKNKLSPGITVRLYVKAGDVVLNGLTTFPGEFHITSHNNNDTINPKEKFSLHWSSSVGASLYIIKLGFYGKISYHGKIYSDYVEFEFITRDTSHEFSAFPYPLYDLSPTMKETADEGFVRIIAMDKNYYDQTYLKRVRAGLDNGYGCFSSGVVDTVRLYFKK